MDNTTTTQTTTAPTPPANNAYAKRPLWQWLVIYLVLALIVYGIIYYIIWGRNHNNPYNYGNNSTTKTTTTSTSTPSTTATSTTTNNATTSNIYQIKTDASKGSYLADFQGMTLYTYDQDKSGVSNCTGSCTSVWPPYTSGATAQGIFPTNISVITRSDGSKQFAYKGMPLYYYSGDTQSGQINGDGVSGFHLATK